MKGFTFYNPAKRMDVFIVTPQKRKSATLAGKVIKHFGWPNSPEFRKWLMDRLSIGECEVSTLANGKKLIKIRTATSSTCDPEEKTEIINL